MIDRCFRKGFVELSKTRFSPVNVGQNEMAKFYTGSTTGSVKQHRFLRFSVVNNATVVISLFEF